VPSAVYQPESDIHTTLAAAKVYHFDTRKQLFKLTENEALTAADHLASVINAYREVGFQVALNDFDAGQLRINVAVARPLNLIKLDMTLLCGVERNNNQ
jgi:EAL domain-containing protein (putative c-di-GMP-specific phosphodiesterase class I)